MVVAQVSRGCRWKVATAGTTELTKLVAVRCLSPIVWSQSFSHGLCMSYVGLPHSMAASEQSGCLEGSLGLQAGVPGEHCPFITYAQKSHSITSAIVTSPNSGGEGIDTTSQWEGCHSYKKSRGCEISLRLSLEVPQPQMAKDKISDLTQDLYLGPCFLGFNRIDTVLSCESFPSPTTCFHQYPATTSQSQRKVKPKQRT